MFDSAILPWETMPPRLGSASTWHPAARLGFVLTEPLYQYQSRKVLPQIQPSFSSILCISLLHRPIRDSRGLTEACRCTKNEVNSRQCSNVTFQRLIWADSFRSSTSPFSHKKILPKQLPLSALSPSLAPGSNSSLFRLPHTLTASHRFPSVTTMATSFPPSLSIPAELSVQEVNGSEKPLSAAFWDSCQREAMAALHNPFVVGLAADTLPVEAFQHYVAQDAYFLSAFAKAYALARERVGDDSEAERVLLEQEAAVEEELKLHSAYAKSWGVDLATHGNPSSATLAYTSFLLETAAGQSEAPEAAADDTLDVTTRAAGNFHDASRAARIVAAMVPCMRLYAFLGQQLRKIVLSCPADKTHRYADWIDTYASADFEAAALQLEALLDRLGREAAPQTEARGQLRTLYQKAMQLEVQFFSAQPLPLAWKTPLLAALASEGRGGKLGGEAGGRGGEQGTGGGARVVFAFDFDSTCTHEDSSPVLAELGMAAEVRMAGGSGGGGGGGGGGAGTGAGFGVGEGRGMRGTERVAGKEGLTEGEVVSGTGVYGVSRPAEEVVTGEGTAGEGATVEVATGSAVGSKRTKWNHVAAQYMAEYTEFLEEHLPEQPMGDENEKRAAGENFDAGGLRTFLEALSEFEVIANQRVESCGVLAGVDKDDIKQKGTESVLRKGCMEVLRRLKQSDVPLKVISVSWSRSFIEGALWQALGQENLEGIDVHSNELRYGPDGRSNGALEWKVQTALDKEKAFQSILDEVAREPTFTLSHKFHNVETGGGDAREEREGEGERAWEIEDGAHPPWSFFVGDSVTDLLALLHADVGIVIGESGTLRRVCNAFGVALHPLVTASRHFSNYQHGAMLKEKLPRNCLYMASGWEEIEAFLCGVDYMIE